MIRKDRGPAVVFVTIASLGVSAAAVGVAIWIAVHDDQPIATESLLCADFLAFSVIGAVVALARPGNRIGWLMLAAGVFASLGEAGTDIADHDLLRGGAVPGASAFAVGGACARTVGWYLATVAVPIYFPDGAAPTGRWRLLPRVMIAGIGLGVLGTVIATHAQLNELPHWHNPLSTNTLNAIADPMSGLSLLLNVGATIGAVVRLVKRWRHGAALERQQIGLFAAVAVLPIFAVIFGVAGVTGAGTFGLMLLPLPIGIGFAVLARGLYDLATAANRTLVWLTLSGVVVGIYALVIAGVGSVLRVKGVSWLPWVAAAVVALSFAPLRDALQRGVNRVTFGRWDDPYQVLSALGQHLEASADVEGLLAGVTRELEETLGLRHVTIIGEGGTVLAGDAMTAGSDTLPLVAFGATLGALQYTTSSPLRSGDGRLLDNLAGRIAGLLHAHQLTHDLQRARERLVLAREEERRRLRRDLHDGLGPALAGHILRVDLATRQTPAGSTLQQTLEQLREELQSTVADVRRVVEGLRPPALDEMGFAAAVSQAVERLARSTTITTSVRIGELPTLSAAVEVAAYRIVTEAVTNVVRHAAATCCRVSIDSFDGALHLSVDDDGRGVNGSARTGHGLETMRERAEELGGRIVITAPSTGGTEVVADLPLDPAAVQVSEVGR